LTSNADHFLDATTLLDGILDSTIDRETETTTSVVAEESEDGKSNETFESAEIFVLDAIIIPRPKGVAGIELPLCSSAPFNEGSR